MLFKNIFPSKKLVNKTFNTITEKSQYLKNIILQCEFKNKTKDIELMLEYLCFLYTLEFYRQVMEIKYSKFVIETTIRTIFITLEKNLNKAGNNIPQNFLLNLYLKLNNTINQLYNIAKQNGVDEFELVASYLLSDECQMADNELKLNQAQITKIASFFYDIINIDNNNTMKSENSKTKNKEDSKYNYTIIIFLIILVIVIIILLFVILNNHYQTIINNYETTIEKLESMNSLLNRKLDAYRSQFSSFDQYSIERNIK